MNLHDEILKSALDDNEVESIISWINQKRNSILVNINRICFDELKLWSFVNGELEHKTGKFFKIQGLNVKTNYGEIHDWDQPIINQDEVGYLGFITKKVDGILKFLVQAKVEPGNIDNVQLSPTIQATKSNYSQVHKGRAPYYLEYFQNVKKKNILVDQLHSEQGSRFLMKRNRNIIIYVEENIKLFDDFKWISLGQLNKLLQLYNIVNMDARTVMSCIQYRSHYDCENRSSLKFDESKIFINSYLNKNSRNTIKDILFFLTNQKFVYNLSVHKKKLNKIKNWSIKKDEITHFTKNYFKIIAVDVKIQGREVNAWTQPMIQPAQNGLCVFICKYINSILHFATQAKVECGSFDTLELAPSIQTLICDNKIYTEENLPFISYVRERKGEIIHDSYQSEEGGRFYKEQNRNMIILADNISEKLPEKFIWMTLYQLNYFTKFSNILNIQARNLISVIPYNR